VSRLERGTTSTSGPPRDGHGDAGHFPQRGNLVDRSSGLSSLRVNLNLIEVARVAYFARDRDEMSQSAVMTGLYRAMKLPDEARRVPPW